MLREMVNKLPHISGVPVVLEIYSASPGGQEAWHGGKNTKKRERAPGSLQLELLWEMLKPLWP